jgi:hypothetical protein
MISNRVHRRSAFIGIFAAGLLVAAMTSGCSEKKETKVTPTGTTASGQPERRVTTGADPDKAPAYPGMYGAPAGSR